jgi:hypothetical protein
METLNYEATIELEANIKIKNQAETIYQDFLNNVKLDVKKYKKNGAFEHWSDSHNATYFYIKDEKFYYECKFLHEHYVVEVTPSGIFDAIKKSYRGVSHLESAVRAVTPK